VRKIEGVRKRERDSEWEREREWERGRERELLFLFFQGMTGALAPFSYRVIKDWQSIVFRTIAKNVVVTNFFYILP